ncbi:MATE family efflux transporter [Lachnospira eligens]|jgi:putative MATE family efflux protein|uniref:Probable multidrug resistance protein NorM n=1 Tax=Lachnospira eligens TaxID=39485 RepID=A0A413Z0M7_9FIRM|nr:MATE family efflux transporter [Lachnospira eligens]RHC14828.1 MATE family efflux transporter [Lachnospira eligens]
MVKDMTNGSPSKHILGFAVPMLFGMLFQQFYNLVDTIIVGKTLGVEALAGVGATGSINFMIIGFCMGVCNGFVIPVAQCFGAKKPADLRKYVFNGYICSIVFAILLTLASVIFCRRILIIMNTPADIIDHAYNYIVVIFIGIPTVFLYNMVSGVIRSLGDSKTPVVFLVLSSIINVVLDFFLILVCKMGVAGAGWATVTSQLISGLTCLIYMYKKYDILKGDKSERVLDRRFITNLCMNGVPMGLQYSITAIGSTILQAAVNTLGSTYVAAMTAGSKMFNFTCCPFDALGSTMATYAGQNVGAAKIKRLGQGVRSAMIIGSVYSVLSLIALYFTTDYIALLFVNASETTIIALTRQFILASACFYIPLTGVNVVRFCIQGMGFSVFAISAGILEMIGRAFAAIILIPSIGFMGACLASPIAWIAADAFLFPAFIHCAKKLNARHNIKSN